MIDLKNSIVKVISGEGQGSGVLLQGGYVLTAYHNIKSGKSSFCILNEGGTGFDLEVSVRSKPVEYMDKNRGDFIIYELVPDDKTKFKSRFLPLHSEIDKVGLTFDCYGFPNDPKFRDNGLACMEGEIRATKQLLGDGDWGISLKADPGFIEPGFSGSPIYCPKSQGVVGIILIENKGVAVFGVGATRIIKFLPSIEATGYKNKLFDKKLPNLDIDLFSCNREDQFDDLKTYFDTQHRSRAHQHIFLFADTKDKPDSLVTRFIKELQGRENAPQLKLNTAFTRYDDLYDYFNAQSFPKFEEDLLKKLGERLQLHNKQQDYHVFFWELPGNIWKNETQVKLLEGLLQGELLKKYASEHRLMIVYWLKPKKVSPSKSLFFWQKHICPASKKVKNLLAKTTTQYCLLETWNDITERNLEDWFDQFCRNIARANNVYRTWLKDQQQLKMTDIEEKLEVLIKQHNPNKQHLYP